MVDLSKEFEAFTSRHCNRFEFLKKWMHILNIPYKVVTINDLNHIFVQFPSYFYTPLFHTKTVIVHYDRAVLSPSIANENSDSLDASSQTSSSLLYNSGANDNSAAVYQTLMWVKNLLDGDFSPEFNSNPVYKKRQYNVRVVFSDGEELPGYQAGSFGLAEYFIKHNLAKNGATASSQTNSLNNDIFVLDGCGRGEVLTISTAGKNRKATSAFSRDFSNLYDNCCNIARQVNPESWMSLPVPYGDNAGFIANAIPALMITMLPKEEATLYLRQMHMDKKFSSAVMNHEIVMHGSGMTSDSIKKLRLQGTDPAQALLMSEKLPKTWRMMHTEFDTTATLSKESFKIMQRFLDAIALNFVPV